MIVANEPIPPMPAKMLEILARFGQISASVSRAGSEEGDALPTLLELIARTAAEDTGASWAGAFLYHSSHRRFEPAARLGGPQPEENRIAHLFAASLQIKDLAVDGELLCLPWYAAGQPVGALVLALPQPAPLDTAARLILDHLCHMAAAAIFQSRRLESAARKAEELEHLRRAGLLISSRLRLEETLEAILDMALEMTGAHYGIFRLLDKSGQFLITSAVAGEELPRPMIEALPCDSHSVMGWVALNRVPVRIADLKGEPWRQVYYPLDAELEMRSELAVPLISAGGRLEGVLNLESPEIGAFDESDSHMLQSMATQAVIAIQEVRLLDALQEAAQLLLEKPLRHVLARLVELACDLLNTESSAIWTVEDNELVLQAACGDLPVEERIPLTNLPLPGENELSVPLLVSGRREGSGIFGVRNPGSGRRFTESEWEKKVLTCLAHYAALAVQNAAHQNALRAAQEQRAVSETFAAVGDIAANVLHHLNNKVGTIPVRIQGIQDKCARSLAADPYLNNSLAEIERSANEAMEAVRENLTNLRPITLAEVGAAACVHAALAEVSLPESITVRLEGLDSLPPVVAAQRSLTLVFANLLENAAHAMQGSGTITLYGAARGSWVEISVSDDGPGIRPELHDRIFELNFSGRGQARTPRLGFGLWWVKALMARLGGSVAVESDGLHGTTFCLRLPVAEQRL